MMYATIIFCWSDLDFGHVIFWDEVDISSGNGELSLLFGFYLSFEFDI